MPFSDIACFFQWSHSSGDRAAALDRPPVSPKVLKELTAVTFRGRGGRLALDAFEGVRVKDDVFLRLRNLTQAILTDARLPVCSRWTGPKCLRADAFTAYCPQVDNCMIWKHDVGIINPPKNRDASVAPLLARLYAEGFRRALTAASSRRLASGPRVGASPRR